jgi:hypothetical protein
MPSFPGNANFVITLLSIKYADESEMLESDTVFGQITHVTITHHPLVTFPRSLYRENSFSVATEA